MTNTKKTTQKQKITPRNFVAKHAPTNGSGVHKDKKYLAKNGINKHKLAQLIEK